MQAEDQGRIERFLAGEGQAFAEVDEWIRRSGGAFRERLGADWEDTLQDVRLEITRLLGRGSFRGDSSLKTYVWRVTANACLDRLRSRRRVVWDELEAVDQRGDALQEAAETFTANREARDLMLRVLADISQECKRLWQMLFDGLSYREMAEQMGVAEGALRVRVLRCRRRAVSLRDELLSRPPSPAGNTPSSIQPKQVGR
ncbi:MAG TPA: sigma-70 family RNA polymerase sigma factor [Thermoanaerobaculia bacterium]|nr:sigma-70 family RNA polymerase sigma factor [Thermoanaerobaculia bacterium]